jgi:hypothetical protein
MADGPRLGVGGADALGQASALAAERLGEYVELWQSATAKLLRSEYHAEDLIDDWFTWWGKVLRDTTAAMTVVWGAGDAAGGSSVVSRRRG